MNLLAHLRDRTRPHHEAVEREFGLFDRSWSANKYRALLRRFFGYYDPLERQIEAALNWSALGFDWQRRRKAPLLQRDLCWAGDSPEVVARLPGCHALPDVSGLPKALGCLYVLEGATLGGQVVTRYLTGVPSLENVTWFSFFSSYGAEVGSMWREFGEFLTVQALGEDKAIIRSACETFTTLADWLRCEELV
jgi:heme oxygenase